MTENDGTPMGKKGRYGQINPYQSKKSEEPLVSKTSNLTRYDYLLQREATILGNISSPYVIKIIDLASVGYSQGIIMEDLQAQGYQTLFERYNQQARAEKSIDRDRLASFAIGLDYAFEDLRFHNVEHLDVNPNNIMVKDDGDPPVIFIDFNSALSRKMTDQNEDDHHDGTPRWIAPERIPYQLFDVRLQFVRNHSENERTHIWYTAGLLRFLATGNTPYGTEEESLWENFASLIPSWKADLPSSLTTPPFSILVHDETAFANAINKALQTQPKNRYPTMEAFMNDLLPAISPEVYEQWKADKQAQKDFKKFLKKPMKNPDSVIDE